MATAESLKAVMRQWASGVTVVTSAHESTIHGMTVTAFSSVSVSPPRILVCTGTDTLISKLIAGSGRFAVHILAAGQIELSRQFAGQTSHTSRFEGVDYEAGEGDCPLISGVVAILECSLHQAIDIGDHVIQIGDVQRTSHSQRDPLLYHGSEYREILYGRRRNERG